MKKFQQKSIAKIAKMNILLQFEPFGWINKSFVLNWKKKNIDYLDLNL